jgi:hypothetical protein
MGYTDIILECLHNIYIIQATVSYFIKFMDLPICSMYLLWSSNLNYVFQFHNSYREIAELLLFIMNQIMYELCLARPTDGYFGGSYLTMQRA